MTDSNRPARAASKSPSEDCGHFLAEEAPDRVVSALRAFMART